MANDQHSQKRVEFDFAVKFSNGGSLQGEGFRLDIPSDDITDDELADYLIRDLRLLMVRNVRISNKRIIVEPHKRGLAAAAREALTTQRHIDLSHTVEDGSTEYPSATRGDTGRQIRRAGRERLSS
jgi:arylformamidase